MSNKIKRNAIKAASVGMAAMMAATPLTAFAAEPETDAPATEGVAAEKLTDAKTKEETTYAVAATKAGNAALADTQQTIGVEQEDGDKVDYAEESLAEAQKNINTMKSENKTADDAEADNQDLVTKANDVASDAKADMNQAAADFAAKRDAVNNATTIEDANAASADANEVAEQAQKDFAEAEKNYNDLVEKIKTNNAVIATAQEHYEQARKEGGDNLASAEAELEMAKLLAEQYEADAQAASERLAASGAALIINAQEAVDNASSGVWTKRDQLFDTIIKEYYVPNVLEGTVESVSKFVRPKEAQVGSIVYGKNGESQEANYVEVIYTDKDGNKGQKLYLNYKVEDGKLLIFAKEKVDYDVYRYTDEDGKFVEIDPATNENVVTIEGNKYLKTNAGTREDIITGNQTPEVGKTVVTDIEESDAVEYKLENGNVVRVIKGTVTRVTKTSETLKGDGKTYKTQAEAEAAAAEARRELKDGLAENESVEFNNNVTISTDTEYDTKYVAATEYAPQFQLTITKDYTAYAAGDISAIAERSVEIEAKYQATLIQLLKAGYSVLGCSNKASASRTEDYWGPVDKYNVHQTISVSFAKLTPVIETVDYSTWKDLSVKEYNSVKDACQRNVVDPVGGLNLQLYPIDLKINKATIAYDKPVTKTVSSEANKVYESEAEAKAAAEAARNAAINAEAASLAEKFGGTVTGSARVSNSTASEKKVPRTVYKYDDASYTKTTTNVGEELEEVAKVTYGTEALNKLHVEGYYSNEHFYSYLDNKEANKGDILLFEKSDEKFNDFLAEHKAEVAKQSSIAAKAQAATELYVAAQGRVTALQNQLAELDKDAKSNDAVAIAKRAELEVALAQAEDDMKTAKDTLDAITGQLTAVATDLANRIAFLTPAPAAPVAPAAPAAAGGVVVGGANPAAAQGAGLVRLNPIAAPLANVTLDGADDADDAAEEDVNLQQVVESNDVETALSDMTLEDDAKANTILGWWWLLIVAVLGGTGYTMYRKFQQKKAAEKIDKTK